MEDVRGGSSIRLDGPATWAATMLAAQPREDCMRLRRRREAIAFARGAASVWMGRRDVLRRASRPSGGG